jgi:hypothetical protein
MFCPVPGAFGARSPSAKMHQAFLGRLFTVHCALYSVLGAKMTQSMPPGTDAGKSK